MQPRNRCLACVHRDVTRGCALAAAQRCRSRTVADRANLPPAQPDFSGTWERYTPPRDPNAPPSRGTPGAGGGLGPTFGGTPPPLKPEFAAAYEADVKMRQEAERRGEPIPSANAQCIPEGMPAMMIALFPMEVLQTRGQLTIVQEAFSQIRRIYIGEDPPAIEDAEPTFFGHSGAKWEGDTLVVETVGSRRTCVTGTRRTPLRCGSTSECACSTRIGSRIRSRSSIPCTHGPWSWTWTYQRKPGYKMYEYVCEDNREFVDPDTGRSAHAFQKRSARVKSVVHVAASNPRFCPISRRARLPGTRGL